MELTKNKRAISSIAGNVIVILLAIIALMFLLLFIKNNLIHTFKSFEERIPSLSISARINVHGGNNHKIFDNITFDGLESHISGKRQITRYIWDFGDGINNGIGSTISHTYYEPGDYNVTLYVLDNENGFGKASVIIRISSKNRKNMTRYSENPLFMIPDKENNWRKELQLVPVTKWYSSDILGNEYPYIVYYNETKFNNSDVLNVLDRYAGHQKAIVFDSPDVTGTTNISIEYLDPYNYTSFWEANKIYSVVLVDYDNYDDALIASLFSGYYNSPMFFVNRNNINQSLDHLKNNFINMTFYIISDNVTNLDWVDYYITAKGLNYMVYGPNELRHGDVNRMIKLGSEITVN